MIDINGLAYLDVAETVQRLGVKPETLYAYVSRGLLQSYKQGIRRRRLYLASEVEALLALHPRTAAIEDEPALGLPDVPGGSAPAARETGRTLLPRADEWAGER